MVSDQVTQTVKLLQKDFSLDQESLPESVSSIDELKKRLIPVINFLLNKDMSRLLNALYRIDISETKVKEVLTESPPDNIGADLAELIIEREQQKVMTRLKYRDQST